MNNNPKTKLVWDEIDGMYRKFMWDKDLEYWVEVDNGTY